MKINLDLRCYTLFFLLQAFAVKLIFSFAHSRVFSDLGLNLCSKCYIAYKSAENITNFFISYSPNEMKVGESIPS